MYWWTDCVSVLVSMYWCVSINGRTVLVCEYQCTGGRTVLVCEYQCTGGRTVLVCEYQCTGTDSVSM